MIRYEASERRKSCEARLILSSSPICSSARRTLRYAFGLPPSWQRRRIVAWSRPTSAQRRPSASRGYPHRASSPASRRADISPEARGAASRRPPPRSQFYGLDNAAYGRSNLIRARARSQRTAFRALRDRAPLTRSSARGKDRPSDPEPRTRCMQWSDETAPAGRALSRGPVLGIRLSQRDCPDTSVRDMPRQRVRRRDCEVFGAEARPSWESEGEGSEGAATFARDRTDRFAPRR